MSTESLKAENERLRDALKMIAALPVSTSSGDANFARWAAASVLSPIQLEGA